MLKADPMEELKLTEAEHTRSLLLCDRISSEIRNSKYKAIPFSRFMQLALYDPHHGYYTATPQILGPAGDFMTAPEMGDLFGKFLTVKILDIAPQLFGPLKLYEFGAGSGRLAVTILKELGRFEVDVAEYSIFEVSPALEAIQRETLKTAGRQIAGKVKWRKRLPRRGIEGIVIANEVVDAMPVELFSKTPEGILQGYVVESEFGLKLEYLPRLQPDFKKAYKAINFPEISPPYTSELHCQAEAWIRTLAEKMLMGAILISDYGFPEHEYYHPDRKQGTLVCHRRHRLFYDPMINIGCQDITAHVNFSALKRQVEQSNMEVGGFTNLGGFLANIGLFSVNIVDMQIDVSPKEARQIKVLGQLEEMGELFKVMELTKHIESTNTGFTLLDRTHRL